MEKLLTPRMKKTPYKIKVEDTPIGKKVQLRGKEGQSFTIETVFTTSESPDKHLSIYDSEGDLVSWPLPGDKEPKPINIGEITVELPISLVDEEGGNTIILRKMANY